MSHSSILTTRTRKRARRKQLRRAAKLPYRKAFAQKAKAGTKV